MKKSLILTGLLTLLNLSAYAQMRGLFVPNDNGQTEPATNEKRIALVIGNKSYSGGGWQPLRNPINDANLMISTLRSVGFEVTYLTDASREQMLAAVNQLAEKINGNKQVVALVYYAGHGVEADGKNWLVPVNDRSTCRDDISANCIALDFVNQKLKNKGAAFNILISDACRNNTLPFTCASSGRDGSQNGFVQFKAQGSCIAFSTAPNATAADGTGSNSPYTASLAKAILGEDSRIEDVFSQVFRDLQRLGQEPWQHNAFTGKFFFKMPTTPVVVTPTPQPQPTPKYEPPVPPKNADYTESVSGVSFSMKYITGNSFSMGSSESDDEKPIHTVRVGNFFMSKYEVTFNEYDAFCDATGRKKPKDEGWGRGIHPVIRVSWDDADAYCVWLSKKSGKEYRLPTEAEWEYAAKGGQFYKYSGSDNIKEVGWTSKNSSDKTHDVGQLEPNGFGLYDMSGNVWEWCSDWYKEYPGSSGLTERTVLSYRVIRGGSWYDTADNCRTTYRYRDSPSFSRIAVGFRVCSSVQ